LQPVLSLDQKSAILGKTSLFRGLNETELARLAGMAKVLRLSPKETLFCRGDRGDYLYVVVNGVVRIGAVSADGREVTLNLIKAGRIFGEIAALDGSERTADAAAVDPVVLLALHRDQLLTLLTSSPEASLRMLAALCDRLRWVSSLLDDVNFLDVRGRLAKRLLLLGQRFEAVDELGRPRLALKLSQQDLASHIGATRESVNKMLRQWEEDGIIAYDQGYLVILDAEHLASLFEGPVPTENP
jgi:CRP-like cAMP-binding protein